MKENKKQIINSLLGIELNPSLEYLKLGNFSIWSYNYFKQMFPTIKPLDEKFPENSVVPNEANKEKAYLIYETNRNVKLKSFEKNFSNTLNNFLNLILYIKELRAYNINKHGNFYSLKGFKDLYFGGEEISFTCRSFFCESYSKICILDDKIFKKRGNNKKIFEYIENEPSTEIERKIKLAISWIGQSLCNHHLDEAYMGLCIALETLLSGQNSPMERGTAYQLREFGAFLAERNKEKRLSVYKDLKDLYNIRCEISHSGRAKNLTMVEYNKLLKILKSIIHELFVLLETKNITTHKKLQNHINELKFE